MATAIKDKDDTITVPCGGSLSLAVNGSTVKAKFEKTVIGKECGKCPYSIFCSSRYEAKEEEPPKKTISVYAFTGMFIGELEVIRETKDVVDVETKAGQVLSFSKKTGLQRNCKNEKFANRISFAYGTEKK